MKTEFDLIDEMESEAGTIRIVADYGPSNVSVCIEINEVRYWMSEKDTERFAVNILKALKSKKLK